LLEIAIVKALNEVNYISMFATAKALEMTIGENIERRMRVSMKGTQANKPIAGPLQFNALSFHYLSKVNTLLNYR
jgi:hypothetical protein